MAFDPDEYLKGDSSNQSWGDYLGEGAQDFARAGVNAATFGMADRAVARLTSASSGRSYDEELAKNVADSEASRERSPVASVAGDVAGALTTPGLGAAGLAARTGTALAARGIRGAPALGRAIGYGGTGAITGAAQGAGNTYTGNPWDYAENALKGFGLGGAFGAAGGAAFGPRPRVSAAVIPDAARTGAVRDAMYDALRASPARYTRDAVADRADDAGRALRRESYYEGPRDMGGSPRTFRTVDQMYDPPTARTHVSPDDLDRVRKNVTGDRIADTGEESAGRVVRRQIDDFIQNPPRGAVVPGTEAAAREAAGLSRTAHQLHGSFKRQQFMENMISNAERQAGSTHSGLNLRNELQKAIKNRLAEKEGASQFSRAGFNNAERAELDRFTRGQGAISQGLGYFDKVLGGGGGLGALATLAAGGAGGHYFGDDAAKGLGLAGLGLGLRLIGNRRAAADVRRINELIGQRNPLYQQRVARAGTRTPGSPMAAQAARDAAALVLLNQLRSRPEDKWE